jgi:RNA polymerase sigma-70 factor (ECF subfamily)
VERRTDEELIAVIRDAYAAGDANTVQAAFCHIQFRHQGRIRARVILKLPREHVEEMVQEVFLATFEAAIEGKQIANLRAWLNKVAANHVADYHRGRDAQHLKGSQSLDADDAPDLGPVADGGQGLAELEQLVESVLARLSDPHRTAVELALFQDRPAHEAAAASGESEANVYQIVRRFRVAFRAALDGDTATEDET